MQTITHNRKRDPLRKVVAAERTTETVDRGFIKHRRPVTIEVLTLECGHKNRRNGSTPTPRRARCRRCGEILNWRKV